MMGIMFLKYNDLKFCKGFFITFPFSSPVPSQSGIPAAECSVQFLHEDICLILSTHIKHLSPKGQLAYATEGFTRGI